MKRGATLLPLLFLVACNSADSTPGATNPAEAEQLNDAAAMLDANTAVPAQPSDPTPSDQGNAQ